MEEINYNVSQVKNNKKTDKGYWVKLGIAKKAETNFWIKLESLPIPNEDGEIWLNLFERKYDEISEKNEQGKEQEALYKNRYASKR